MNILILGYGLEGKSVENYFKTDPSRFEHTKIDILDSFTKEELLFKDLSGYDLIFRTPSIPPKFISAPPEKITSVTKYFFANCPCPIIGVTGTKGKGTTCTMIRDVLQNLREASSADIPGYPYLVGNIGMPALDVLPDLTSEDIVIYELSSFQLWDLDRSPNVSVVLRVEPDHLDVHESFDEYLSAKHNIVKYQSPADYTVYFKNNENTQKVIEDAKSQKLSYPTSTADQPTVLTDILSALKIPGDFNKENLEAAILAVFATQKTKDPQIDFLSFLEGHKSELTSAAKNFHPLPHHLEFVRKFHDVSYYDDSFSTVFPSLEAAISAFSGSKIVLIAGGKDKGFDLTPTKRTIFDNPNIIKTVLIGETAKKLAQNEDPKKYFFAETDFALAVDKAREFAEAELEKEEMNSDTCLVDKKPLIKPVVVLLSPCASSFDMFSSYKARGDIFKQLVNALK